MATAAAGMGTSLDEALASVDSGLASVLQAIAHSVADISVALRTMDFGQAGSTNSFGDDQLQADLHADELIFGHLRSCPAVASASSEETSDVTDMGGRGYTVAFDPLDGSSIFGANFAVGSIFGVWPGDTPIGQTGRDQAAAAYSVYGPRTLLVVALPVGGDVAPAGAGGAGAREQQQQECSSSGQAAAAQRPPPSEVFDVLEFVLQEGSGWQLRSVHVKLGSANNVAPANIRAAAGNAAYAQLLQAWISSGCKLRYSGGMVPDVHHALAKGGGVFCNPASPSAPAKLRLLYECAPVSLVVEAAGGMSHDGSGSILDAVIRDTGDRSIIALGTRSMVTQCLDALRDGGST